MLPGVVPEENADGPRNQSQPSVYQIAHVLKVAFACFKLLNIKLSALKGCKDQLYWCDIVSMRRIEHYRQVKCLIEHHTFTADVIWSSIHCQDGGCPPVRIFFIKLLNQVSNKQHKDLAVSVNLSHAEPHIAFSVQSHN